MLSSSCAEGRDYRTLEFARHDERVECDRYATLHGTHADEVLHGATLLSIL